MIILGFLLVGLTFQGQVVQASFNQQLAVVNKKINALEAEKTDLEQSLRGNGAVSVEDKIKTLEQEITALNINDPLRKEYQDALKNKKKEDKFKIVREENVKKNELQRLQALQKKCKIQEQRKERLVKIEEELVPLRLQKQELEQQLEVENKAKEEKAKEVEEKRLKEEKERVEEVRKKEKRRLKMEKRQEEAKEKKEREEEEKRLEEERKQKQIEATRANQEKQRKEKELKEKDPQAARQLEAEKRERKAEEKRRQEAATARKEANRLEKEHKAKEEAVFEEAARKKREEEEKNKAQNQGKPEVGFCDAMMQYVQEHPILVGSATASVVLPTSVFGYFVVKKHSKLVKKQEKAIKEKETFKYEDQNLWLVASKKVLGNMSEAVKRQGRKIRSLVKSNDKKVKTSEVA